MAEHGDGNIKVVVRCRPLNSRGSSPSHRVDLSHYDDSNDPKIQQSLFAVQSHLSVCRGTKRSLIHPKVALHKTRRGQQRGKRWRLALTGVIGALGREMNPSIALSRRCMTIWERNCWIMGLRVLTRAYWLVS